MSLTRDRKYSDLIILCEWNTPNFLQEHIIKLVHFAVAEEDQENNV